MEILFLFLLQFGSKSKSSLLYAVFSLDSFFSMREQAKYHSVRNDVNQGGLDSEAQMQRGTYVVADM